MTDFYGQLEEQLMAAGQRRAQPGAAGRAVTWRRPRLLAAAAATAAAAVVAFLPGAGPPSVAPPASPQPAPPPAATAKAPGNLRGISVAVLNATTQAGRARDVADRLAQRGATIEAIGNHVDQSVGAVSLVRYRPGAAARALRVAKALGVPSSTIATADDLASAGGADVVVVVGTGGVVARGAPWPSGARRPPRPGP